MCVNCINTSSGEPEEECIKKSYGFIYLLFLCLQERLCERDHLVLTHASVPLRLGKKILCSWCLAASTITPAQMMTEIIMTARKPSYWVWNQVCLDMGLAVGNMHLMLNFQFNAQAFVYMSPLRVSSYLDHLVVIDVLLGVRPQQAEMVVCSAQRAAGHTRRPGLHLSIIWIWIHPPRRLGEEMRSAPWWSVWLFFKNCSYAKNVSL